MLTKNHHHSATTATMSGSNESAFFHAQYANALQAWKDKKPLEADNICRMLVAEFPCP